MELDTNNSVAAEEAAVSLGLSEPTKIVLGHRGRRMTINYVRTLVRTYTQI